MSDDRPAQRERVQVIEGVERHMAELSRMAIWLADNGSDAASILVEDAARNMAAGFILNAPIGARVPGLRAESLLQAVDGRRNQAG